MSDENPNLKYYEELIHAEDAIQFDGLDYAIVGVSHTGYYIYDFERMVDIFIEQDGMTMDEAYEWIEYNVASVNSGNGFIIMDSNEGI